MEEVCSICGVPGYEEMMALCDDCNQVSEHIYCMRNHLDEVPDIWFCESCQVRRDSDSLCPTTSSNMHQNRSDKAYAAASLQLHEKTSSQGKKQKSIDINEVMVRGLFIPDKRRKGFPEACSPLYKGNKSFKAPEAGKVKFIPEAEAAHLRTGAKAMLFYQSPGASGALLPRKGSTKTLPMKNVICRTAKRSFPTRSETTAKDNVDSKLMKDASLRHNDHIGKQTYACVQASGKTTEESGRYGSSNEEPKVATSTKIEKPIDNLVDASTCLRSIVAHPLGRASKRDSSSPSSHLIKNSGDRKHNPHFTLPENWEMNISWRGSFEVHGTLFEGNIYQGIEAYRSNAIGHKALEALGRMPSRLIAVLLPRFKVWPRIFQKQFPDADDVALYFLPSDCESSKERYIRFLKMIDTSDLAIRCHFEGANLLVFLSKHLSVDSQRQTLEPYLWGVLCRPSTLIPASRNGNLRQQFLQQVEPYHKSNNACEVKLEEEGTSDIRGKTNGGVGFEMQRSTSVKNVVKPSILTAANPWNKMGLRGSCYDLQHTQIKQEEHPNVPLAQNSRIQLGQNDSILSPMLTEINAVASAGRGTCEGPPGFSRLTSLDSKDPCMTSHDSTGKRIFEGSVQKP